MAIEWLLYLSCTALLVVTAWQMVCLSGRTADFAQSLQQDTHKLLELRYRKEACQRLKSLQKMTESTVSVTTGTIRGVHKSIADIPFGVLEAIPVIGSTSKVVRKTHDLISDVVYGSILGANKVAGKFARDAMQKKIQGNIMYQQVLEFWFETIESSSWWKKDLEFDTRIANEFGELHAKAVAGELYEWREKAQGRLAEIIVLDQFSRNIFRDTPQAFAADALALELAQEAVHIGADKELNPLERSFLYMPYMHSESALIHEQALKLYKNNGIESNLQFEIKHKEIIDKFGRYPHRNAILGRESTAEELEFLKQPGSSF